MLCFVFSPLLNSHMYFRGHTVFVFIYIFTLSSALYSFQSFPTVIISLQSWRIPFNISCDTGLLIANPVSLHLSVVYFQPHFEADINCFLDNRFLVPPLRKYCALNIVVSCIVETLDSVMFLRHVFISLTGSLPWLNPNSKFWLSSGIRALKSLFASFTLFGNWDLPYASKVWRAAGNLDRLSMQNLAVCFFAFFLSWISSLIFPLLSRQ